ncbi:hypothetical protein ACH3XW_27940 [Acanthocheilonema viteae]
MGLLLYLPSYAPVPCNVTLKFTLLNALLRCNSSASQVIVANAKLGDMVALRHGCVAGRAAQQDGVAAGVRCCCNEVELN